MSEYINGYRLLAPLSTNNAGMCRWGFAERDGREFFIKEFLSPKYPVNTEKLSEAIVQGMRAQALAYYGRRRRFYDELYDCRTGNVVVVQDFFRSGACYYAVSERIRGPFLGIGEIARLTEEKKRTLCKAVLYSIGKIHEHGIVHSDIKPDNIIVKQTSAGFCTAKLIDFDASFFYYEAPDEIEGDQVYFSPEALLHNAEEEAEMSVKMDIFALGLLFHQYWSGDLPVFDRSEYSSASDALLDGAELKLSPVIPADIRGLIRRMLSLDPAERPDAKSAWEMVAGEPVVPVTEPKKSFGGFTPMGDDDL